MKHILLTLFVAISSLALAQTKYLTKTGSVTFEASVPSFEEVKGTNSNTTAIINTDNGEFAALVLVKGFRFKNALMEEHFNENYAESDQFPKATFKGKVNDFDLSALSESNIIKSYKGSLTFHGNTKQLENDTLSAVINEDGTIILTGMFEVDVADFDIKIPKIVSNKVSRTVKVSFEFQMTKK